MQSDFVAAERRRRIPRREWLELHARTRYIGALIRLGQEADKIKGALFDAAKRQADVMEATLERITGEPCRPSPTPDPIFALIEAHRAALKRWAKLPEGDPRREFDEIESDCWVELLATKPKTLAGLAAFAEYILTYPEWDEDDGERGAVQAVTTIAEALRDIVQREA